MPLVFAVMNYSFICVFLSLLLYSPTLYSSSWAIKCDSVPLFLQFWTVSFFLDIETHWRFDSRCYHKNCQWKQRESMNSQNAVLRPCLGIKGIKLLLPVISRWILRLHMSVSTWERGHTGFMCAHRQTVCTMPLVFAGHKTWCVGFLSYSKVSLVFLYSFNPLSPLFSLSPASSLCHATHVHIGSFSQCARRASGHHRQLTHIYIVLSVPLLRPIMKNCLCFHFRRAGL